MLDTSKMVAVQSTGGAWVDGTAKLSTDQAALKQAQDTVAADSTNVQTLANAYVGALQDLAAAVSEEIAAVQPPVLPTGGSEK